MRSTTWTIALFLLSAASYSQTFQTINDSAHFCFTVPQTRFIVKTVRNEQIHKAQILNLQKRTASDSLKIRALENTAEILETIDDKTTEVVQVLKEKETLTKKEIRKAKRKAIGDWFRHNAQKIGWAVGGFAAGGAVGLGAGFGAR